MDVEEEEKEKEKEKEKNGQVLRFPILKLGRRITWMKLLLKPWQQKRRQMAQVTRGQPPLLPMHCQLRLQSV